MDYTMVRSGLEDFTRILSSRLLRLGGVVSVQTFLQLQGQPNGSIAPAVELLSCIQGTILCNQESAVQLIFDIATFASFREFVYGKLNCNHQTNVSIENIVEHLTDTRDKLKGGCIDANWLKQIVLFYSGMLDIRARVSDNQLSTIAFKLDSFLNQTPSKEKEILALGSTWYHPAFCLLPTELHPLLVDIGIYLVHRGIHLRQLFPSDCENDSPAALEQTILELFQVLMTVAPRDKLESMFERLEREMRMLLDLPNPPYWVFTRVDVLKRNLLKQLGLDRLPESILDQLEPINTHRVFEEGAACAQTPEEAQYEAELAIEILRLLADDDDDVVDKEQGETVQPPEPGQTELIVDLDGLDIGSVFESYKENITPDWKNRLY